MSAPFALLVLALASPAARQGAPGASDEQLAPLVEGFLAGYRASAELEQRRRSLEALAGLTRARQASPLVARALGEGLADASFALRIEVLRWLAAEDGATVAELLPRAARELAREAPALERELEERRRAAREAEDPTRQAGAPAPRQAEEALALRAEASACSRRALELERYAEALAQALGAQGDEPALEGLLALGEAPTRLGLASPAYEALAALPCERALDAAVARLDALERERATAEDEERAARAERARPAAPKGWSREAWREAEVERLAALRERAQARVERLSSERERLCGRLETLARAHGLPRPPAAFAPAASWTRWRRSALGSLPALPRRGGLEEERGSRDEARRR